MAKYLDATGVSTLWGKIKSSFASTGHTHNYLPLSGGTITDSLIIGGSDIPEVAGNLASYASLHSIKFYRNGFLIPYQMENTNDGGFFRVRGTTEDNVVCEIGTWDDYGTGETIQFNYYPTTSTITPTYSVSVPKATGTLALTSQIPTNNNQLTNGAGYITSSGSCSNADTVDGYHEYSFLRWRGAISTTDENTLWDQIGIKQYTNALPDALATYFPNAYTYGEVISLCTSDARFDIYANHGSTDWDGVYVRSGWATDKRQWKKLAFTDSNVASATYASTAGSVAWTNVSGKPDSYTPSSHNHNNYLSFSIDSNYLAARFHDASLAQKAADTYIEFWQGQAGWFNLCAGKFMTAGGNSSQFVKGDGTLDSNTYLPLAGGTMTGTPYINMPASAASISDSQPFGITYGRVQSWGNLNIAADTDSSTGEYVIITSGYGVSSATTSNGLAIGQNSLTWKGNNIIHSGNISSQSVNYANSSNIANYFPTLYIGGDQPNPQTYFSSTIGLRAAMTRYADIGMGTAWHDTLWINGYSGGDVPYMCALHFKRNGEPRFAISSQQDTGTSYGTMYEVITNYNISSQSVNYANYSGYSTRLDGGAITGWGTLTSGNGFSGIAACDYGDKGAFCWAGKGGQMYMQVDGWFYQNEGQYRVLDTSDAGSLSVNYANSAGNADTVDGYHYNNLPYAPWKEQWIDMTGYSESYWHPVVTSLPYGGYRRIKVTVQLNSGTKPSWSTHDAGFTCNLDLWTTAHGWGTTNSPTICLNSTYGFANQNPVGWFQLGNASHGILLLRGGGKYLVCTDWDSSWTIYNQSVTDYGGTQYEQTCGPYTSWPGIFNGSTTKNTIYAHIDGNATTATSASSVPNLSNSEIDNIIV